MARTTLALDSTRFTADVFAASPPSAIVFEGVGVPRPTEEIALGEVVLETCDLPVFIAGWLRETAHQSPADALYLHYLLSHASSSRPELYQQLLAYTGMSRTSANNLLNRLAAYATHVPDCLTYLPGVNPNATQEITRTRSASADRARRSVERRYAESRSRLHRARRTFQDNLTHLGKRVPQGGRDEHPAYGH